MQYFDAGAVHRLLDYPGLIAALDRAHREIDMPDTRVDVMTDRRNPDNKFVSLVGWAPGEAIAVKLVGVFPGNVALEPPQPSVQGLVAMFNARTGLAELTADGAALTFRKTAADSALGSSYLSRPDSRILVVVGAGGLAPHVIEAHRAVRPSINHVMIWNRHPARAVELAARLTPSAIRIEAVTDLDRALAQADIVSAVTMAREPVIRGALLKPGTHVDLVGAYMPDMREADDDVVLRARQLFVDTRAGAEGSGDVGEPLRKGLIKREGIVADLFDLARGNHPGRTGSSEITLYKNVGGCHLDLFTMQYLKAQSRAAGHA